MDNYVKEKQSQKRKEYYRKWRAEHRDSVRASQVRYWTKKAAEMQSIDAEVETRGAEEE